MLLDWSAVVIVAVAPGLAVELWATLTADGARLMHPAAVCRPLPLPGAAAANDRQWGRRRRREEGFISSPPQRAPLRTGLPAGSLAIAARSGSPLLNISFAV